MAHPVLPGGQKTQQELGNPDDIAAGPVGPGNGRKNTGPDQSHGQPHIQEKQEQPAVPDEFFPVRLQKIPEGKDLEQVKGLEDQHKDQRAQKWFQKSGLIYPPPLSAASADAFPLPPKLTVLRQFPPEGAADAGCHAGGWPVPAVLSGARPRNRSGHSAVPGAGGSAPSPGAWSGPAEALPEGTGPAAKPHPPASPG